MILGDIVNNIIIRTRRKNRIDKVRSAFDKSNKQFLCSFEAHNLKLKIRSPERHRTLISIPRVRQLILSAIPKIIVLIFVIYAEL